MGSVGERAIVGDQNEGGVRLAVQLLHQLDHPIAGAPVQIPGRFIGEEDPRTIRERAGERHPLTFPSRQLGRIVGGAVGQPHPVEKVEGAVQGIGGPVSSEQLEGHQHVLQRREGRKEMERLEDEPDIAGAKPGPVVFRESEDVFAGEQYPPRGGRVEAREQPQEGRLSGSRRTDDRDDPFRIDRQIDTLQHRERPPAASIGLPQILRDDHMPRWLIRPVVTVLTVVIAGACGSSAPDAATLDTAPGSTAEAQPDPIAAPGPRVVFLGTSLTAGLGLRLPGERWPEQLGAMADSAGIPIQVVNAGRSGDTSTGGLARLEWLLQDSVHLLVVELGANDGLRGLSTEELSDNLREVIARTRAAWPDAGILLVGMEAPTNLGGVYTDRFRAVFPTVADDVGASLVPFLLDGVAGVAELNQADRIHPTAAGHEVIARTVWPYLEPLLHALSDEIDP